MGVFVYRTRRREIRRQVPLKCQIVREQGFKLIGGRALDLSPNGMLAIVSAPVDVGESVIVSFRIEDLGLWFDTDAHVARVLRGRRSGDPEGLGLGLEFGSLEAVSRLILRGYLRHFLPPVPKRELPIDYAATVWKIMSIPHAA